LSRNSATHLQHELILRFNPDKENSHIEIRRGVSDTSYGFELGAAIRDSYSHSGSCEERLCCRYTAPIQDQIGDSSLEPKVRLPINNFDRGNKSITHGTRTLNNHREIQDNKSEIA